MEQDKLLRRTAIVEVLRHVRSSKVAVDSLDVYLVRLIFRQRPVYMYYSGQKKKSRSMERNVGCSVSFDPLDTFRFWYIFFEQLWDSRPKPDEDQSIERPYRDQRAANQIVLRYPAKYY